MGYYNTLHYKRLAIDHSLDTQIRLRQIQSLRTRRHLIDIMANISTVANLTIKDPIDLNNFLTTLELRNELASKYVLAGRTGSTDIAQEIKRGAPRFLFRGWSQHSCGGRSFLNTPHRITPPYYNTHPEIPVKELGYYDDKKSIRAIVNPHLHQHHVDTQFSSWTNCFGVALSFARHMGSGHISFIDREFLSADIAFYNAHDLFTKRFATSDYSFEWIAHGTISGPGLFCVSISDLQMQGFRFCNKVGLKILDVDEPVDVAVVRGITFACLQLGIERHSIGSLTGLQTPFYALILTWLAIQSNKGLPVRASEKARSVIMEILDRTGLDVPHDLSAAYQRQYTTQTYSHCERTRQMVKLIVESRFSIENTIFHPGLLFRPGFEEERLSKVIGWLRRIKEEIGDERRHPLIGRNEEAQDNASSGPRGQQ